MVRIKGGTNTRRKHKRILGLAKGYWMTRHKQIKKAYEAVLHAGQYAFAGRKLKRRDLRAQWIIRLNASLRMNNIGYGAFIHKLKTKKIELDRKVLASIALDYPETFKKIVSEVTS